MPAAAGRVLKKPASRQAKHEGKKKPLGRQPTSKARRPKAGPPPDEVGEDVDMQWLRFRAVQVTRPTFTVASDCSGWCSEVLAAKLATPLPVLQAFASDTDLSVRRAVRGKCFCCVSF